jgi:hypothetical protein
LNLKPNNNCTPFNIVLLSLFNMAEDSKKDKDKGKKTMEEKADRSVVDKHESEQPEEEEIQEHPEH